MPRARPEQLTLASHALQATLTLPCLGAQQGPSAEGQLLPFPRVRAWLDRVPAAVGRDRYDKVLPSRVPPAGADSPLLPLLPRGLARPAQWWTWATG